MIETDLALRLECFKWIKVGEEFEVKAMISLHSCRLPIISL